MHFDVNVRKRKRERPDERNRSPSNRSQQLLWQMGRKGGTHNKSILNLFFNAILNLFFNAWPFIVTGAFEVANAAGFSEWQHAGHGGASSGGRSLAAAAPSPASSSATPSAATPPPRYRVQPDSISRTERDTHRDRELQSQAQTLAISGEFLSINIRRTPFQCVTPEMIRDAISPRLFSEIPEWNTSSQTPSLSFLNFNFGEYRCDFYNIICKRVLVIYSFFHAFLYLWCTIIIVSSLTKKKKFQFGLHGILRDCLLHRKLNMAHYGFTKQSKFHY